MPGHTHHENGVNGFEPPDSVTIVLIAAVAKNGVIGDSGEIPWYYPEDLAHFKEVTTDHPVIMGRKTFENIQSDLGGPLPNRTTVVLSRRSSIPASDEVIHAASLEEAFQEAAADAQSRSVDDVYVAGGGAIYEASLPYAEKMVLTELDDPYPGDVEFPSWNTDVWSEADRDSRSELSFVTYHRQPSE
jgi:dihydrofolate reductase